LLNYRKNMNESKFKYRINEELEKLPTADYRKAIRNIPKLLAISPKTFGNYRNIRLTDKQDIPHEKVIILEKLLNLKPGELENFVVILNPDAEIIEVQLKQKS
jgi:hypothetical protein